MFSEYGWDKGDAKGTEKIPEGESETQESVIAA